MPAVFATASDTTLFWMLYAAVAGPMLVGLLHGRAGWSRLLLWPLSAAVATVLIATTGALVNHAVTPAMSSGHPHLLTAACVALLPALGYGLGRLAARSTPA